jgi:murein DD-endopeptidase MepM/ murein hydrolase activator NlpD
MSIPRQLSAILLLIGLTACSFTKSAPDARRTTASSRPQNVFDAYIQSDFPAADGFDFPVGDANAKGSYVDPATGTTFNGWYIATQFNEEYSLGIHTGEDWNGSGGGNTDLGQQVHAVANGRVTFARACGQPWGNVITIKHYFYENNQRQTIVSLYAHLKEMKVTEGATVSRRQVIATIGQDPGKTFAAHLHLELRLDESLAPTYWPSSNGQGHEFVSEHYTAPSPFINNHRNLPVPQQEKKLLLVDHESYKARLYEKGGMLKEFDVSFGQAKGQKLSEGDNKTPKGMYFVIQKHKGNFGGAYGEYYGGYWIKINYPNRFDAERGVAGQLISNEQLRRIATDWGKRAPTPQDTKLGGGIGFHGWIKEWDNSGPRHLSWGCVVMHLKDIPEVYDALPEGTMVVIF